MSVLIVCLVVLVVLALVLYLIQTAPVDARLKWLIQAICVIIAILVIISRVGLTDSLS